MQAQIEMNAGPHDELFDTDLPLPDGTNSNSDMFTALSSDMSTALRSEEENGEEYKTAKFGKMEETESSSTKPSAGL